MRPVESFVSFRWPVHCQTQTPHRASHSVKNMLLSYLLELKSSLLMLMLYTGLSTGLIVYTGRFTGMAPLYLYLLSLVSIIRVLLSLFHSRSIGEVKTSNEIRLCVTKPPINGIIQTFQSTLASKCLICVVFLFITEHLYHNQVMLLTIRI